MTEFQPIDTAPLDGTTITVKTAGGHIFRAAAYNGFINEKEEDVWAWVAVNEGDYPSCWTDGVCWGENEDGIPSDRPVEWKP